MAAAPGVIGRPAADQLPRLLYIGDVPVADTVAGGSLLFRLLQFYPPERLAIVCAVTPGMPKLPGVAYHDWGDAFPRLLRSRLAEGYCLLRALRYYMVPRPIARIANAFQPGAILTVSHVGGWLCAWQLAVNLGIPFHLIAHDDGAYAERFPPWSRQWAERKFAEAYRAARSRFCISDGMREGYTARYGVPGSVMYPIRDTGDAAGLAVAPRVSRPVSALTFAYAGSIDGGVGLLEQIRAFAREAAARGHRLVVYSPQYATLRALPAAESLGIEAREPVSPSELLTRLRDEADCLLLPQLFGERVRDLAAMAFPSKWADYSASGLPVLVWAPPGSSSERFVRSHPECAELVTGRDPAALGSAIERLEAPSHRSQLAGALLRVGRESFSPEAAWQQFKLAVSSGA